MCSQLKQGIFPTRQVLSLVINLIQFTKGRVIYSSFSCIGVGSKIYILYISVMWYKNITIILFKKFQVDFTIKYESKVQKSLFSAQAKSPISVQFDINWSELIDINILDSISQKSTSLLYFWFIYIYQIFFHHEITHRKMRWHGNSDVSFRLLFLFHFLHNSQSVIYKNGWKVLMIWKFAHKVCITCLT